MLDADLQLSSSTSTLSCIPAAVDENGEEPTALQWPSVVHCAEGRACESGRGSQLVISTRSPGVSPCVLLFCHTTSLRHLFLLRGPRMKQASGW
ncbi:hypothetical protein PGIGA_G00139890 [Pangasianodon gigas]|uniref:Uncharacterized protein n=1 Tax=Pangasianodon gigas TaxID=30993 RepID=A0ACC5XKQ9_PANGG|nr:hypothetical protein [Pangasianodon gigas]